MSDQSSPTETLPSQPQAAPPSAAPVGPPTGAPAVAEAQQRPRTFDTRVLIASTVGAFVIGGLVGGGFGALIGYVSAPNATNGPGQIQRQGFDGPAQQPGLGRPGGGQPDGGQPGADQQGLDQQGPDQQGLDQQGPDQQGQPSAS